MASLGALQTLAGATAGLNVSSLAGKQYGLVGWGVADHHSSGCASLGQVGGGGLLPAFCNSAEYLKGN